MSRIRKNWQHRNRLLEDEKPREAHYVVTEFGVAQLRGKTVKQRAEALINIAHPDFQDELRAAAKNMKVV